MFTSHGRTFRRPARCYSPKIPVLVEVRRTHWWFRSEVGVVEGRRRLTTSSIRIVHRFDDPTRAAIPNPNVISFTHWPRRRHQVHPARRERLCSSFFFFNSATLINLDEDEWTNETDRAQLELQPASQSASQASNRPIDCRYRPPRLSSRVLTRDWSEGDPDSDSCPPTTRSAIPLEPYFADPHLSLFGGRFPSTRWFTYREPLVAFPPSPVATLSPSASHHAVLINRVLDSSEFSTPWSFSPFWLPTRDSQSIIHVDNDVFWAIMMSRLAAILLNAKAKKWAKVVLANGRRCDKGR